MRSALIRRYLDLKYKIKNKAFLRKLGKKLEPVEGLKYYGSDYGGWVIPETLLNKNSICYLGGAGIDISFDLEIADIYECNVHIFDPTPQAKDHFDYYMENLKKGIRTYAGGSAWYPYPVSEKIPDLVRFHPIGLWKEKSQISFYLPAEKNHVSHSILNLQNTSNSIQLPVDRISHIMKELGHDHIELLKIDIEGAEYQVINSLHEDNVDIRALCIEFDEMNNPLDKAYPERIKNSLDQLTDMGFSIVNMHSNFNLLLLRQVD